MIDQLISKIVEQGGIWCALCVYMILSSNRRYTALEKEVRDNLSGTIKENTLALKDFKENTQNANKNGS